MELKPHHYGRKFYRFYLWFLMISIPVAWGIGAKGYWCYQHEHHLAPSCMNAWYHALQLFVLHMPHLDPPINNVLELGRWLAAVVAGSAAVLVLHYVLWTELRRFRLWLSMRLSRCSKCIKCAKSLPRRVTVWLSRKCVIVCGLGDCGTRLATDLRKSGVRVFAIERDPDNNHIQEVQRLGVTVILGDAKSPATLQEAYIHQADKILAVCTDEDTNVAIATAAGSLAENRSARDGDLECFLLVDDVRLRNQLHANGVFPNVGNHYSVHVRGVDLPQLHARHALEKYPLDFGGIARYSKAQPHLILVGCGGLGLGLALKALQIASFANAKPLRLTVLAPNAGKSLAKFQECHSKVPTWYDSQAINLEWDDSRFPATIATSAKPGELVTIAFCCETDGDLPAMWDGMNLTLALATAEEFKTNAATVGANSKTVQLLACVKTRAGFGSLLENRMPGKSGVPPSRPLELPIHAVGIVEDAVNLDTLLHEKQDLIARALHQSFCSKYHGDNWRDLNESLKESNRQAGDHIPVKLRAIGLQAMPIEEADRARVERITEFSPAQEAIMSQMEHQRWLVERWLAGWTYGEPKNEQEKLEKRINRNLVDWDKLSLLEQNKDPEQIRAIPAALNAAGLCIAKAR
jgi:hypothetical protein